MKRMVVALYYLAVALLADSSWAKNNSHATGLGCVEDYYKIVQGKVTADNAMVGISPDRATQVTFDIAERNEWNIDAVVIDCGSVSGATVFVPEEKDRLPPELAQKNFVIYDPDWIQLAAGDERDMILFVLAHELAHLVKGHLADKKSTPRVEQESEADYEGACTVAKLGGSWPAVVNLIPRIRPAKRGDYPSAKESLSIAQRAFDDCQTHPLAVTPALTATQVVYWYKRADDGRVVEAVSRLGVQLDVRQSGIYKGIDYSERETDTVTCYSETSIDVVRSISLALFDAGVKIKAINVPDSVNAGRKKRVTIEAAARRRSTLSREQIERLSYCPLQNDPIYGKARTTGR